MLCTGEREPLDLNPRRWDFAIHMLDAIFFPQLGRLASGVGSTAAAASTLQAISQAIQDGIECSAIQSSPHVILLLPDFYKTNMQSLFGEWGMQWLSRQTVFKDAVAAAVDTSQNSNALARSQSQTSLVRQLSKSGTELTKSSSTAAGLDGKGITAEQIETAALHYITETSAELEHAELIIEEHLKQHPIATKLLNLARQWVCSFMPHCLSKINRVSSCAPEVLSHVR